MLLCATSVVGCVRALSSTGGDRRGDAAVDADRPRVDGPRADGSRVDGPRVDALFDALVVDAAADALTPADVFIPSLEMLSTGGIASDDFESGTIDALRWTTSGAPCQAMVVAGALELELPPQNQGLYCFLTTRSLQPLANEKWVFRLGRPLDELAGLHYVFRVFNLDLQGAIVADYYLLYEQGDLRLLVNGQQVGPVKTYDPKRPWLRWRDRGTNVVFQASMTEGGPWIDLFTASRQGDPDRSVVQIGVGTYTTLPTAHRIAIGCINTTTGC